MSNETEDIPETANVDAAADALPVTEELDAQPISGAFVPASVDGVEVAGEGEIFAEPEQDLHDDSAMQRAGQAHPDPVLEELHESQVIESLAAYAMLSAGGVGTIVERQSHGWKVKYMSGGTALLSEGESLGQALGVA